MLRGTQDSSPPEDHPICSPCFINGDTDSEEARASPGPNSHFSSRLKKNSPYLKIFHLLSSMGLHFSNRTSPKQRSWGQEPAQFAGGEEQVLWVLAPNCQASPWSPHHFPTPCFGRNGGRHRLTNNENNETQGCSIMGHITGLIKSLLWGLFTPHLSQRSVTPERPRGSVQMPVNSRCLAELA